MPDFDIDFCMEKRDSVIDYVSKKYGSEAVSQIATFGTMAARAVVRDVARALGKPYAVGDRISKMIPFAPGMTLDKAKEEQPIFADASKNDPEVREIVDLAYKLEGIARNVGKHAGGVVIAPGSISDFCPIYNDRQSSSIMTQYDKDDVEKIGLVKFDFLGLRTLTVIDRAVKSINANLEKSEHIDLEKIPLDDPKVFELLSSGKTMAVFQLESTGMRALIKSLKPTKFEEITALLALYRPGPLNSGMHTTFVDRKHGKSPVSYPHELLEPVLSETYGVIVYQEQVMEAARVLAGYSMGEADILRRVMGKKKIEEMEEQREIFIKGCEKKSISAKKAEKIFELIEQFAEYGFNKSHSAAYGLISYQTAYLKANYPVEFMAALLSNEINNTDKISVFVEECKSMGIKVLPPDVNKSLLKFSPEDSPGEDATSIRYGLAAIKNVGAAAMDLAINERVEGGAFDCVDDFARRQQSRSVNKKILESLTRAGAFDFSGEERARIFARVDSIISAASLAHKDRVSGQGSLFDEDTDYGSTPNGSLDDSHVDYEPWSEDVILAAERELLGFYVTGHPLDSYRSLFSSDKYKRLSELQDLKEHKKYNFMGRIAGVEKMFTKKAGKPFAKLNFEEFTGQTEVMVWSEVFVKSTEVLQVGKVIELLAKVEIDSRSETKRLTAEKIKPISKPPKNPVPENIDKSQHSQVGDDSTYETFPQSSVLNVYFKRGVHKVSDLHMIRDILVAHPGPDSVALHFSSGEGSGVWIDAGSRYLVENSENLRSRLKGWVTE